MDAQCAALDSSRRQCATRTKEGSKWCPRHDQERKKLYTGYKSHHASLDAFPENTVCRSVKAIHNCSSYDTVKVWSKALRNKHNLLNRCIQSRLYFTQRFFGNDMDFGHKTFWHYLHKQRDEVEALLEAVERKAYQLLLASQDAMWVLEQQHNPPAEDCGTYGDEPISKPEVNTLVPSTLEDIEDPLDVAIREKCAELWEKIWTRLSRYCAPTASRYCTEREAVIWACVCRAIYTEPALMLLAQNYDSVKALVTDTDLDVPAVDKLWKAIKGLNVDEVRAAIDDVLNPERDTSDYVVIFGTRVHRKLSGVPFPFHGWGHMTAVFPCYSCVRRTCKTVEEIVALTRYTILTGSNLAQSNVKYDFQYEGCQTLFMCGFIPNTIEDLGERYTIEKENCCFKRNTPHWTETKLNNAICVGLSLKDPLTQDFVNRCLRHPDFMVLCRKGPNGRLIRPKPLRGTEFRRADTRAGLKNMPWDPADANHFQESVLEEARPLTSTDRPLDDCFQMAIVDGGDGNVQDFIKKLEEIWFQIYDVTSYRELLGDIGYTYLESKELEVREGKKKYSLVENTEPDHLVAYERMWKRGPREGRLVDDELGVKFVVRSP